MDGFAREAKKEIGTMKLPDFENGETAIDVLRKNSISNPIDIDAYLEKVFIAWHEGAFGDVDVNKPMGLSVQEYLDWGDGEFVLKPILQVASSIGQAANLQEASWALEVGSVKAELGEIEAIYQDFNHIFSRLQNISDIVSPENIAKVEKGLNKAFNQVEKAEMGFRAITKSAKAPDRSPIKHSTPTANPKREMERISGDLAKLSVRVRNIGQATDELENLDVGAIPSQFEAASETLRKVFVIFEKLIP